MLDIGVLLALQVVFDADCRLCLGQRRHVRYFLVGKAVPAILQEPRKKRLGGQLRRLIHCKSVQAAICSSNPAEGPCRQRS